MPQNTIVSGQNVNEVSGNHIRNRSKFPLGRPNFGTYRFGEYGVSECLEVVPDDSFKVRPVQEVQTYTMGAPLMQDVNLKQDAFLVPMQSILPLNWDKFFVNPVKGDDVPNDVNTVISDFSGKLKSFIESSINLINSTTDIKARNGRELKLLIFMEMFYSEGSLLSSLGKHYSEKFINYLTPGHLHDYGNFFDLCMDYFWTMYDSFTVTIQGKNYKVTPSPNAETASVLGFRDFLCIIRDTFDWTIVSTTVKAGQTAGGIFAHYGYGSASGWEVDADVEPLNYARCCAYQLACAHFFTNDKIDYVYSAELYRELIGDSYRSFVGAPATFTVNGLSYQYDWLSGNIMSSMLNGSKISDVAVLEYIRLIFGYNYSLRYLDYFTGARSQPLAVGNVDVAVNNNYVSVIDITQNIMKQKFLNSINRVGQRIENYTKELFGVEMAKDFHNPFWLFHTSTSLNASDTENTGAAQLSQANSVTSRLFGSTGKKEFSVQVDRAGILIVINYFDVSRLYCRSSERAFFHEDRFDMFNPYLQFVGDQKIYGDELRGDSLHSSTFGYTGRYMEYKQRYPVCFGAFRYHLPGFAFIDDYNNARDKQKVISPSFIRSIPTELDRFYVALTGYSLDTYFHFIIKNMNTVDAVRPMAYNPGILNG